MHKIDIIDNDTEEELERRLKCRKETLGFDIQPI